MDAIGTIHRHVDQMNAKDQDEAFDHIWPVMDAGLLPDAPPFRPGDVGRCEKQLIALDDRLAGGIETESDRALLNALPVDSLAVWIPDGITARDFVGVFAKIFRML